MIRFIRHQYKYARRVGFSQREAIGRAVRIYINGF